MMQGGFAQQPTIEEDKPALRWVSGGWWVVASLQTPPYTIGTPRAAIQVGNVCAPGRGWAGAIALRCIVPCGALRKADSVGNAGWFA